MTSHTFELPEIKEATSLLISKNSEHLISYVYSNPELFPSKKIRVGLCLKVLLKSDNETHSVNRDVLENVTVDLQELLNASESDEERELYSKELRFLNHCSILDDVITLNTNLKQQMF